MSVMSVMSEIDIFPAIIIIGMFIAPFVFSKTDKYENDRKRSINNEHCKNCVNRNKGGCWDGSSVTGSMWKQPGCTALSISKNRISSKNRN